MEAKKTKKADLSLRRGIYFNIGLIVALSLAISAFEWKTYGDGPVCQLPSPVDDIDEILDIPITHNDPPPPKPKIKPIIVEVDDDTPDTKDLSEMFIEPEKPIVYEKPEPIIEEVVDPTDFTIVESMPKFEGGKTGFMKHIAKKIKYPRQARKMGIEGKVFVQFVIDEAGQIVDVVVIKGIGAGCDEEAARVIGNAPKWTPGKQRGKPVRVKMVLPINFTLG